MPMTMTVRGRWRMDEMDKAQKERKERKKKVVMTTNTKKTKEKKIKRAQKKKTVPRRTLFFFGGVGDEQGKQSVLSFCHVRVHRVRG